MAPYRALKATALLFAFALTTALYFAAPAQAAERITTVKKDLRTSWTAATVVPVGETVWVEGKVMKRKDCRKRTVKAQTHWRGKWRTILTMKLRGSHTFHVGFQNETAGVMNYRVRVTGKKACGGVTTSKAMAYQVIEVSTEEAEEGNAEA